MSTKLTVDGVERVHGFSAYRNLGCRCTDCRAAWNAYIRDLRRVRAQRLTADPSIATHGSENTYTNWSCRCQPCRDAHAEQGRRQAHAKREVPS